ncbi:hypothetical protein BG004_004162 [Podila humilis]|nr:hypothetical protein BG004_004162 [Podila humilis]
MSRPSTPDNSWDDSNDLSQHSHLPQRQQQQNQTQHPRQNQSDSEKHTLPRAQRLIRKKSILQVHWHPSVNEHQQSKRTRHILSVLAILVFFSSVTAALYHFSGCDITSGKCQRFPRDTHRKGQGFFHASPGVRLHSTSKEKNGARPPTVGESGMTVKSGTKFRDDRIKSKETHPWNMLYTDNEIRWESKGRNSGASASTSGNDRNHDEQDDGIDRNNDLYGSNQAYRTNTPSENPWESNQRGESDHDENEDENELRVDPMDEYPVFEVTQEEEGTEKDDNEKSLAYGGFEADDDSNTSTPEQAYSGIWIESTESLTEDDYLELEEDYQSMSHPGQTFVSRLEHAFQEALANKKAMMDDGQHDLEDENDNNDDNDNEKAIHTAPIYMTYLPAEGLSNQFFGMLRAIMLAKSLGRTLVLPPITSSRHNQDLHQNQPWSAFFDLPTFTYLTGVQLIEMKDLREPELDSTKTEPLECHVAFGVGSLRALDDTAKQFLEQWKFEHRTVGEFSSRPLFEVETTDFNDMVSILRSQEHERLLCLSNMNKMQVLENEDWDLYGQHMYFSPRTEQLFESLVLRLQRTLPIKKPRLAPQHDYNTRNEDNLNNIRHFFGSSAYTDRTLKTPPATSQQQREQDAASYIVIHIRRRDFIEFCQQRFQHQLQQCLPTLQDLTSRLQDLLGEHPTLRGAPVLVVTDEDRTQKLAKMQAMGWHIVNHGRLGTKTALGAFGPIILDQLLMAKARVVIGVQPSAFFQLAAYRQKSWNGRQAIAV